MRHDAHGAVLKGNAILISSVLFSWKSRISVQDVAKYSFSVHLCFKTQTSLVKCFFRSILEKRSQSASFQKN